MNENLLWHKISQYAAPENLPGQMLWSLSIQWRRQVEEALKADNLTFTQYLCLAQIIFLERDGRDIIQVTLGRSLGMDLTVLSDVLRILKDKFMIQREHKPKDIRAKYISLTNHGKKTMQLAVPRVEEIDRLFFAALRGEAEGMTITMKKLLDSKRRV